MSHPLRGQQPALPSTTSHPPRFTDQHDAAIVAPSGVAPEFLHQHFECWVDAQPDAPALLTVSQGKTVTARTYAQLDAEANQLARYLRQNLGLVTGDRVALLLPRGGIDGYVALLGVLKAGAAYVPLDPGFPAERVAAILKASGARTLLTASSLTPKHLEDFGGMVVRLDDRAERAAILSQSPDRLTTTELRAAPTDLCYIIFTSGSTGLPKGVPIEHRNAVFFVRAERQVFAVAPSDHVYQGFSLAFDASVEELWLAWANGAALVGGSGDLAAHAGPELSRALTLAGVSVLSCVPTLLAMLQHDIPTLRLLIVGGEDCPPALVNRWWRADRRMVNTYGPTEATVVATAGDLFPGETVTIGQPLPGCSAYILDEALREVPAGADGELCLSGPGISRGYLNDPELTRAKFVVNPFALGSETRVLYRTGDLARRTASGGMEFRGRLDTQVKVRGFRIELSEIESVLLRCPGVRAAAVSVLEDPTGPTAQQLAAYLVPDAATPLNGAAILTLLREHLPPYMVPAILLRMDELPTTTSGKVDRRRLPAPDLVARIDHGSGYQPPETPTEARLAIAWAAVFNVAQVSINADFFYELGGHSLLAAQLVSTLRQLPQFSSVSILDIYAHPTVAALAAKIDTADETHGDDIFRDRNEASTALPELPGKGLHAWRHRLTALAQLLGLYLVLGFSSVQFLAPYLAYSGLIAMGAPRLEAVGGALASLFAIYPALLFAAIMVKWLVIGRFRPGNYPVWGFYHLRFWFVRTVLSVVPTSYLTGTPFLNIYLRLLGARIGRNVHLGTDNFAVFDALFIGDDASIGVDASLSGYTVEDGQLRIGWITVGRGAFVGNRAVVREDAILEDGARLDHLSLLGRGQVIAGGETWRGSPAAKVQADAPGAAEQSGEWPRPARRRRFACGAAQFCGLFAFQACGLAALLPGTIFLNELDRRYYPLACVLGAPVAAVSFIVLLALEIVAVKWLLLGRVRAGKYPRYGSFYLRKWFVDQLLELSLDVLGPLYATLYLNPWYRALGAQVGRRAEISTASFVSPDLLAVGEESFIADAVSLGAQHVEHNVVRVDAVRIGRRSFIGNSATLPPGTIVGNDCLIGCLSVPPAGRTEASKDGTSWMGSPAIFLPHRQESTAFAEEATFTPPPRLVAQRLAIEFLRVTLPLTFSVVLTSLLLTAAGALFSQLSFGLFCLTFPVLELTWGLAASGIVIGTKWALMGRYRPEEKPLWSTFVWRTELVAAMHEYLASPFLLDLLIGTPFACTFFRLLGAKIGRRVYLGSTEMTEYDLVEIGDDACINESATLQTHLFEDRVMKMGRVRVGPATSIGSMSLVLYSTEMQAGSSLDALSLLMKGETLPAGTAWRGIPARRRDAF